MAKETSDMKKTGSFPVTWLSFKGICAFWNSRSVADRIWVASDFKADSCQLEAAGEPPPPLKERSVWFIKKENKQLDEVRYSQWRTPIQEMDGLICSDQANPSSVSEVRHEPGFTSRPAHGQ